MKLNSGMMSTNTSNDNTAILLNNLYSINRPFKPRVYACIRYQNQVIMQWISIYS